MNLVLKVVKSESTSDETSIKCLDRQTEDNKIKEYLQRSDTAVIFAEPVEVVQTKVELTQNKDNEKDEQMVRDRVEDNDRNFANSNENRVLESGSSNQSKSHFCFHLFSDALLKEVDPIVLFSVYTE